MSSIGSVGGGFRPPPPKPPSFNKLDGDSSGALSLEEFQAGAPKGADSAKTEKLFKTIDADSDGSVSKEESDAFQAKAEKARDALQSFLFGLQAGGTEQTSETQSSSEDDIFAQLDTDSSGDIGKSEFLDAFSQGTDTSSDMLGKLFDAIDSDSDGAISKDEQSAFQQAMKDRGPPPPPPSSGAAFGASQAYGSTSQLGSASWMDSSRYSQAA